MPSTADALLPFAQHCCQDESRVEFDFIVSAIPSLKMRQQLIDVLLRPHSRTLTHIFMSPSGDYKEFHEKEKDKNGKNKGC